MAKVINVRITPVRLPLKRPMVASAMTFRHRDFLLVELECDDGSRGIGFSYIGTGGARAAAIAANELLVPVLMGGEADEIGALWDTMYRAVLLQGRAGLVMNGISAIDIALWDRRARVAGRPLYQELGGSSAPTVPAYASGGYYADGKGLEDLAEEIASYVAMGFNSVKIKAGAGTLREEEQRTATVREVIGPDRLLMLDMYMAWNDLETALSYVEMYQQFKPYWIEDPFLPDDIENYARLAERIPQPVATGEFYYELSAFQAVVERKAASILQAEAPRCGGVTGWNRIATFAAAHDVVMSPDWFHQIHVHLVSAIPNGLFVEYFPDDTVFNFGWLVDHPLEVRDGSLVLPERPGLGFDFLEEAVGRYALAI